MAPALHGWHRGDCSSERSPRCMPSPRLRRRTVRVGRAIMATTEPAWLRCPGKRDGGRGDRWTEASHDPMAGQPLCHPTTAPCQPLDITTQDASLSGCLLIRYSPTSRVIVSSPSSSTILPPLRVQMGEGAGCWHTGLGTVRAYYD